PFAYNADAAALQSALATVASIRHDIFSVTGSGSEADPWFIHYFPTSESDLPVFSVQDSGMVRANNVTKMTSIERVNGTQRDDLMVGSADSNVYVITDDWASANSDSTDIIYEPRNGTPGALDVIDVSALTIPYTVTSSPFKTVIQAKK